MSIICTAYKFESTFLIYLIVAFVVLGNVIFGIFYLVKAIVKKDTKQALLILFVVIGLMTSLYFYIERTEGIF